MIRRKLWTVEHTKCLRYISEEIKSVDDKCELTMVFLLKVSIIILSAHLRNCYLSISRQLYICTLPLDNELHNQYDAVKRNFVCLPNSYKTSEL